MSGSPDWSRLFARRAMGIRLGLGAVRRAHAALGRPAAGRTAVHLVGTNGKGTTAHALAALLGARGLTVGRYTSPHLWSVTERVCVDDRPVSEERLWRACRAVLAVADAPDLPRPLSFFEVLTLAALLVFEEADVDVVVLEAGLGGRLDATRVPFGRGGVLVDVAHNADALSACARAVEGWAPGGRADLVLFGCLASRDPRTLAAPLARCARRLRFVDLGPEGAPPPEGSGPPLPSPAAAADLALRWAARGGACVVAGSFRLAGPVLARAGVLGPAPLGAADPQDPTAPAAGDFLVGPRGGG